MGRIVKGANLSKDRYVVSVPAAAPTNGAAHHDELDIAPIPEFDPVDIPPQPSIPEVDWKSVAAECERLIDQAHERANTLLADAERRAIEMVSDAAARAQEIQDAARTQGFDQGQADGQAAAGAQVEEMLSTMRGLVEMARAERHKIIESAEPELVRLAMTVAEKVVHQQIAMDHDAVVAVAKAAIARLVNREMITVRVNPADIENIREHRDAMLANSDVEHMRFVEDQRVDRGGVIVETDSGTIDAKISTQLKEARRILHAENEGAPVSASPDDSLLAPAKAV